MGGGGIEWSLAWFKAWHKVGYQITVVPLYCVSFIVLVSCAECQVCKVLNDSVLVTNSVCWEAGLSWRLSLIHI